VVALLGFIQRGLCCSSAVWAIVDQVAAAIKNTSFWWCTPLVSLWHWVGALGHWGPVEPATKNRQQMNKTDSKYSCWFAALYATSKEVKATNR
jgi:hypothetical protein